MKQHSLWLIAILGLGACVTTGGMSSKRRYVDPTGVKTADDDAPTAVAPGQTLAERASIDTLKSRIAVLEGELEEAKVQNEQQISGLNQQIKSLTEENVRLKADNEVNSRARISEDTKKAASLLWKAAVQDLSAGRYSDGQVLLKQLLDKYPEDSHAYYAHTATAMSNFSLKKYAAAAGGFAYVAQNYPNEEGIQMAWYGQGAGLYKMLKGSESLLFFKQVASRWPKTLEGKHAAQIVAKKSQPANDLFLAFPNWLKDAPN